MSQDGVLASYERLIEDLATLGMGEDPPADWRKKVRARIRRQRRRRFWWPASGLAAAAILTAVVVHAPRWSESSVPSMQASVTRGELAYRGTEVRPGDTLFLEAKGASRLNVELRLYRNEVELVARCETSKVGSPSAACVRSRDGGSLNISLDTLGRYQPVLVFSGHAVPTPEGHLEADLEAVLNGGGRVEMGDEIVVR